MTPRPLYRWRSFWLGVLVLAFLGWAWARARSHEDIVSLRPGTKALYTFASSAGYFRCGSTTLHARGPHSAPAFDHFSGPSEDISPWFPSLFTYNHTADKFYAVTFYAIAHWLLFLTFFLPWTAFLAWRGRRMKKLNPASA